MFIIKCLLLNVVIHGAHYSWKTPGKILNKPKPAEESEVLFVLYPAFYSFYVDSISGFFSGDFSYILLRLES